MEDPWLGLGLGGVLSPDDAAQPAQVEGEHVDGDDEARVLLHQQLDLHTLHYISVNIQLITRPTLAWPEKVMVWLFCSRSGTMLRS